MLLTSVGSEHKQQDLCLLLARTVRSAPGTDRGTHTARAAQDLRGQGVHERTLHLSERQCTSHRPPASQVSMCVSPLILNGTQAQNVDSQSISGPCYVRPSTCSDRNLWKGKFPFKFQISSPKSRDEKGSHFWCKCHTCLLLLNLVLGCQY